MKPLNYYPTPFETNKHYTTLEATEILMQWGLSINEKKTRDLIRTGKLEAKRAGDDPNDRRSGYQITGKNLYDFIIDQIPIAKDLLKERSSLLRAVKKEAQEQVAVDEK